MNSIALIQSHCNSEEKIEILKKNIKKINNLGIDILLFSHIELPLEITNSVKYYLYDSSNPILWNERRHVYWWANNIYKLESEVPDYGWTVFNQIIKSFNFLRSEDYNFFYIICYDLIINEFVEDIIINNRIGKYKHIKPKNVNEVGKLVDVVFDTSLIFLSLSKEQLSIIVDDLSCYEYVQHPEWTAEKYLEIILDRNNLNINNIGQVSDLIHESAGVFDDSFDKRYEIFVDTQNKNKLRYIKKDKKYEHVFIINEQQNIIDEDVKFIFFNYDYIEKFGVLIDGVFQDLKFVFQKQKINKINLF
jgi:hypothetical protein